MEVEVDVPCDEKIKITPRYFIDIVTGHAEPHTVPPIAQQNKSSRSLAVHHKHLTIITNNKRTNDSSPQIKLQRNRRLRPFLRTIAPPPPPRPRPRPRPPPRPAEPGPKRPPRPLPALAGGRRRPVGGGLGAGMEAVRGWFRDRLIRDGGGAGAGAGEGRGGRGNGAEEGAEPTIALKFDFGG